MNSSHREPEKKQAKKQAKKPEKKTSSTLVIFVLGFAVGGVIVLAATALWQIDRTGNSAHNLQLPLPELLLPNLNDPAAEPVPLKAVLKGPGLVNFWASWCFPCRAEHQHLMDIAVLGVPLYGILYHDDPEDGREFLRELGSPYRQVLVDNNGDSGVATGLTGVPETLVIDSDGVVRGRWVGVLKADTWDKHLKPIYLAAGGQPDGAP